MPVQPYAFGFDSRKGRFGPDGGPRLINGYAEEAPPGAQMPFHLYVRPGLKPVSTLPVTGGFRGGIGLDNRGYVVVGQQVFRITSGGSATAIGSFPGTAPAAMARNRRTDPHIAICSEGQRYLIATGSAADSAASISDGDLGAANHLFFHGGYFVWTLPNGEFQVSALDDGTAYDALDFATAEADPDGLLGGAPRGSEIVLFGSRTIQFFANVPDAGGFPYTPVIGATVQLGCVATHSIKSVNGVPVFVASDGTVRLLDGYQPTRISTHEIERQIDALTPAQKAALRAFTFSQNGHSFYVLSSESFTVACDLLTRLWSDWRSYGSERFAVDGGIEIGGRRIVGHVDAPTLYELDESQNSDDDEPLIFAVESVPFGQFPHRMIVDELYVKMVPGAGLAAGEGGAEATAPEAMLTLSDDDGKSWSDEMTAPLGAIGEHATETSFTGLGASGENGFRFRLSVSAAVSRALIGAAIRFTPVRP